MKMLLPRARATRTKYVACNRSKAALLLQIDVLDLVCLCVPKPAPEINEEDLRAIDMYFEELPQDAELPQT